MVLSFLDCYFSIIIFESEYIDYFCEFIINKILMFLRNDFFDCLSYYKYYVY